MDSSKAARIAEDGAVALDGRLPVMEAGRELLRKAFPDHWSFLLGELALYSFVLLLLTGVYLTFFFNPSMAEVVYHGSYAPLNGVPVSEAYASTLRISFDIRGGLLIRQMHHWAALLFVASLSVHLLRVFFTGAFRRPRELNWVLGVTLFLLAVLEGFCGYSLPDDLLSGTGLRTAQGIVLAIPLVGSYLQFFGFGGEFPGQAVIPRLYSTHILLVPGLLLAVIGAHLTLVVHLKHTQWAVPGRTNRNVVGMPAFPQFAARSAGLSFAVFGVSALLGGLAQINPIWGYGPYRPDIASTDAQPDWYVGFLEGALRLMPPCEIRVAGHTLAFGVLMPTVLLPGLMFAMLYLYPFFEAWLTGDTGEHHLCDRPRNRPTRTGLGVAAIAFYTVLLLAGGQDVLADTFQVSVNGLNWNLRIALLVLPPLSYLITKRVCLGLQERDRERLIEGDETGDVRQSVEGGYQEDSEPLPAARRYLLLSRDLPQPLAEPRSGGPWVDRLRRALSGWYHGDRVELPARPAERAGARAVTAPPGGEEPERVE
ncbi:cytochrome bc complex cytochrome b subunit [Kitasatospora sp. NPDC052896]|uniref:cytochrome bc1 complex cytochrome b subunit n=1 Tax=Kitasatospora sp. NPDC052896 TaxID=3364061 RepID=UPI0037C72778